MYILFRFKLTLIYIPTSLCFLNLCFALQIPVCGNLKRFVRRCMDITFSKLERCIDKSCALFINIALSVYIPNGAYNVFRFVKAMPCHAFTGAL